MEIVISGQGKCCAIAGSFAGNFLGDSKTEGLKRVQSYFKVAVSNMSCERRTWTNHESVGLQFSSPFDAVSSHDDGSLLVWIWWTWPEEVSMSRFGLWVLLSSFHLPIRLVSYRFISVYSFSQVTKHYWISRNQPGFFHCHMIFLSSSVCKLFFVPWNCLHRYF